MTHVHARPLGRARLPHTPPAGARATWRQASPQTPPASISAAAAIGWNLLNDIRVDLANCLGAASPGAFAVIVDAACMAPIAPGGSVLIVAPSAAMTADGLVVIHFRSGPPAVKRLVRPPVLPCLLGDTSDMAEQLEFAMLSPSRTLHISSRAIEALHPVCAILPASTWPASSAVWATAGETVQGGAAPAQRQPTGGPDAPLIALCDQFDALERSIKALYGDKAGDGGPRIEDDEARDRAESCIQDRQSPLVDGICAWRSITLEGHVARARSLALWAGHISFDAAGNESEPWNNRLIAALLRDLAIRVELAS